MAIGDLTARLRAKFIRRNSTTSSFDSSQHDPTGNSTTTTPARGVSRSIASRQSHKAPSISPSISSRRDADTKDTGRLSSAIHRLSEDGNEDEAHGDTPRVNTQSQRIQPQRITPESQLLSVSFPESRGYSSSTAEFSTPNTDIAPNQRSASEELAIGGDNVSENVQFRLSSTNLAADEQAPSTELPTQTRRPAEPERKQSLLPHQQTKLIKTLLESELPAEVKVTGADYFVNNGPLSITPNMVSRKIWVRRPGASATLVTIHEDDLVDDVRDMILKKYANSLGRSFDAPDVTLRIQPREQRPDRILGPEEPMGRTLDAYFPGGQAVDEALVIDVPMRRTPKPSPNPHISHRYVDDIRPAEGGTDYFPQMPIPTMPSPQLPRAIPAVVHPGSQAVHSISVLTTGQVPALPSPGGVKKFPNGTRPRAIRQHTSSPTVLTTHSQHPTLNNGTIPVVRRSRSRTHSSASEKSNLPPAAPPLPTPPAPNDNLVPIPRTSTPPPRVSSPRPSKKPSRKTERPSLPTGMLNAAVPPINVLIVEDNIINLKLLEAFMKKLKVRWQTAMNGREAVNKWRAGGFHLVLMDIQLPIMNGLDATKEIRRLERVNNIGVFSSASSTAPDQASNDEAEGDDKLSATTLLFKSPVIIVALTASSLQSDRHEALAAGCNDFLTKPVNFVWLERKVMEWGCMQALIDFDGWRKWKDFSQNGNAHDDGANAGATKTLTGASSKKPLVTSKKKKRQSVGSQNGAGSSTTHLSIKEEDEKDAV